MSVVTADSHAVAHADHGHDADTNTGVSNAKLAIWLFLSSEALFFGAVLARLAKVDDRLDAFSLQLSEMLKPGLAPCAKLLIDADEVANRRRLLPGDRRHGKECAYKYQPVVSLHCRPLFSSSEIRKRFYLN